MKLDVPTVITNLPTKSEYMEKYPDNKMLAKMEYRLAKRVWMRTRVAEAQNWKCCWCGCDTVTGGTAKPNTATLEHIIPVSKGGTNDYDNLAMACCRCNNHRGTMTPEEFQKQTVRPLSKKKQRYEKKKQKIIDKAIKLKNNGWFKNNTYIDPYYWVNSIRINEQTKKYILENVVES